MLSLQIAWFFTTNVSTRYSSLHQGNKAACKIVQDYETMIIIYDSTYMYLICLEIKTYIMHFHGCIITEILILCNQISV